MLSGTCITGLTGAKVSADCATTAKTKQNNTAQKTMIFFIQ
jgi:hypothetical protein